MLEIIDVIGNQAFRRTDWVGCPICHNCHQPRQIAVKFAMTISIAECAECRIAYQTPQPSTEASHAYMNMRWSSSQTYVADRSSQLRRAGKQLQLVNRFCKPPSRVLDFGAGSGAFVHIARQAGFSVTGVETSDTAIARAREFYGVEFAKGVDGSTFDVVTLWDVVEHLRDPVGTLDMLRKHMNPGGRIFLETGNFENWTRLASGDSWGLYLFDHEYYFTPASLEVILNRAGYKDFRLLPTGRKLPPSPFAMFTSPAQTLGAWRHWAYAKRMWPRHGDINVIVATARPLNSL